MGDLQTKHREFFWMSCPASPSVNFPRNLDALVKTKKIPLNNSYQIFSFSVNSLFVTKEQLRQCPGVRWCALLAFFISVCSMASHYSVNLVHLHVRRGEQPLFLFSMCYLETTVRNRSFSSVFQSFISGHNHLYWLCSLGYECMI